MHAHIARAAICKCAGEDDEDEDEDEEEGPKTETVKETVWDWELLNENKALWLRGAGEVDEEEYANFYKALAKVCCFFPTFAPPSLHAQSGTHACPCALSSGSCQGCSLHVYQLLPCCGGSACMQAAT
jgi:hypothetical protein